MPAETVCPRCGRTSILVPGTACGGVGAHGIFRGCPGRVAPPEVMVGFCGGEPVGVAEPDLWEDATVTPERYVLASRLAEVEAERDEARKGLDHVKADRDDVLGRANQTIAMYRGQRDIAEAQRDRYRRYLETAVEEIAREIERGHIQNDYADDFVTATRALLAQSEPPATTEQGANRA